MPRLHPRTLCIAILLLAVSLPVAGQEVFDFSHRIKGIGVNHVAVLNPLNGDLMIAIRIWDGKTSIYTIRGKLKNNGEYKFKKARLIAPVGDYNSGNFQLIWNPVTERFLLLQAAGKAPVPNRGVKYVGMLTELNAKGRVTKKVSLTMPDGHWWSLSNRMLLLRDKNGDVTELLVLFEDITNPTTVQRDPEAYNARGIFQIRLDPETLEMTSGPTNVTGILFSNVYRSGGSSAEGPKELVQNPDGSILMIAGRYTNNPNSTSLGDRWQNWSYAYLLNEDGGVKRGPVELSRLRQSEMHGRWAAKRAFLFSGLQGQPKFGVSPTPQERVLLKADKKFNMRPLPDPQNPPTDRDDNVIRWVHGTDKEPYLQVTRSDRRVSVDTLTKNGALDRSLASVKFDDEHSILQPYAVTSYHPETNSILLVYKRIVEDGDDVWEVLRIELDEVP